ncbi:MAG: OPT/YSL family transporter [bacterium]
MSESAQENSGFTLRAALIAVGVSLFLLTSSSYIAIKLGALPWPIVFSVIVSGGIIKLLNGTKRINVHEINVAQAGASIGGLVAAGIVFTVPGIVYLNQTRGLNIAWPNPWLLGILTSLAGLLGVLLSLPLKYTFIDEEKLPYPAGTAGAELLKLGKTGGRQLFGIVGIGAAAAIFALVRDVYWPAGFTFAALTALGIYLTLLPMPLAIGSGFILGPRASLSWFFGGVAGWLVLMPLLQNGVALDAFPLVFLKRVVNLSWLEQDWAFDAAKGVVQNLGMGMVLGSGIGFFVIYVIPRVKNIFGPILKSRQRHVKFFPWVAILGVGSLLLTGVPLLAAALVILGVLIMVAVAARMTGETNINPLEQFGIFVGLIIAYVYKVSSLELSMFASFIVVTFVSVACAVAGDAGHDYKSAAIVGTRFFDVVKVDLIAVLVAGFAAPFVLESIRRGFADTLFTAVMPAPQAQLVAGSIFGFEFPAVFLAGFVLAFLAEVGNTLLPQKYKNKVLVMPFGIGLFLGLGLALPIALGSLIRVYVDRKFSHWYQTGLLIAAGIMGGEGIAGFSAGALTTFGLSFKLGSFLLSAIFAVVFLFSLKQVFSRRGTAEQSSSLIDR